MRAVQQYGSCVALSEFSYAVHTTLSPDQLMDKIEKRAGRLDGLQILRVSRAHEGRMAEKARRWIGAEANISGQRSRFDSARGGEPRDN